MEQQWEEQLEAGLPGYWRVMQNGLWGIWSEEKGLIVPCECKEIRPYQDDFAVIRKYTHGTWGWMKWGMVDTNGKIGVRLWDIDVDSDVTFINGYAITKTWDSYGYVDFKGNTISPCIWDHIVDGFDNEGHPALVFRRDENYERAPGEWCGQHDWYFYYDNIPKYKVHPHDPELYSPRGYFYLTPDGRVLTPNGVLLANDLDSFEDLGSGWLEAEPFKDGSAFVKNSDSDSDFIDWNFKPNPWTLQTEKMYEEQFYLPDGRMHNGFQLVWVEPDDVGNCFRILDRNGNPVSPYRWSHVEDMFELDKAPIRVYRRQWKNVDADGIMDEDGSYYFPGNDPSFMQDSTNGLSFHRGYYFLCADGEVLTMSGPVKSEAESELPDGWEWTEVFLPFLPEKYEYHTFCFFPENKPYRHQASILVNGHDIIVDEYGIFFLEDQIGTPEEMWFDVMVPITQEGRKDHLMIRQYQKWGILHKRNKILTPYQWDEIRYTENHIYVRDNDLWGILDPETGELTTPCQLENPEF